MGATKEKAMAGTFLIKITDDRASEYRDQRYRYIWSAWLDGQLLGKGHCSHPDEAIERAHDLVTPDQVEHIEIRES
ncbi:MAG: hypothetical protein ACYCX3_13975 [Thermoleophilia bacterium]